MGHPTFRNIFTVKNEHEGNQITLFDKVNWIYSDIFYINSNKTKQIKFSSVTRCAAPALEKDIEFKSKISMNLDKASPFSFNNLYLTDVKVEVDIGGNFILDRTRWDCVIKEEVIDGTDTLDFLKLEDVQIQVPLLEHNPKPTPDDNKYKRVYPDDPAHPGEPHTHNVFESVEFRDIVVRLKYKNASGEHHYDLILDPKNDNYAAQGLQPKIMHFGGYNGKSALHEIDDDYQMGIVQLRHFAFRCGEQIFIIAVDISIIFKYGFNDFDPAGSVSANKIYPQIFFQSYNVDKKSIDPIASTVSIRDGEVLIPIVDLKPIINDSVLDDSITIEKYFGRIKMVCNNNNKHHVDLQKIGSKWYDKNFLHDLRSSGKIPIEIERNFKEGFDGNILGLFTDTNNSGKPTLKFRPPYPSAQTFLGGTFGADPPSPFWADTFDYIKYHVSKAEEFTAVYGKSTSKYDDSLKEFSNTIQNSFYYPFASYPMTSAVYDSSKIKKNPRQGAYDNVHLSGYLGHYEDNDKLVVHAPICGYCCFHMHWRWGALAFPSANKTSVSIARELSEKLEGDLYASNYIGWGSTMPKSSHKSNDMPQDQSSYDWPLIPWNQTLRMAFTDPDDDKYPDHITDRVLPLEDDTSLDPDRKAIWYCAEILNDKIGDSHVVMEQGCGYAYNYSIGARQLNSLVNKRIIWKLEERGTIAGAITSISNYFEEEILDPIFNFKDDVDNHSFYTKMKDDTTETLDKLYPNTKLLYEILYRIMRFFNGIKTDSSHISNTYKNLDQVPTNHSVTDSTLKALEDL